MAYNPRDRERHAGTWCLVTDIDGTLIGDRATTRALREAVLDERKRLEERGDRLKWVIATGRNVDDTHDVLEDQGFAPDDFDALITAVGAQVHHRHAERRSRFADALDATYLRRLESTGFDVDAVHWVLKALSWVRPQPKQEQVPFKASYFAIDSDQNRRVVAEALSSLPFPVSVVWSHECYLDVAPHNGAKGGAVEHLIETWGLDARAVVAAGDSGNDASMLERHWRAIVVKNGHRALESLRARPGVYFARTDFAAGVLEGLRALGFLD